MKITVAMDNTVPISSKRPFLGEHGFSLLIEHEGQRILLDAGQSSAIINNLSLLGVTANSIDMAVISHGHYDHIGGLYHVLSHARKKMPVYAHPDIFASRFSTAGDVRQYVGVPYTQDQLTGLGAEWKLNKRPNKLMENLWLSGQVPHVTQYEKGDARLVLQHDGCDCQDEIEDDMSLYYLKGTDLIVVGGCTHSGLVNTVRHGFEVTGATRLAGWIGGTHLGPVSTQQQEQTIDALAEWNPDFVAANHCTGFPMMAALYGRFGAKYISAFVGTVIEC